MTITVNGKTVHTDALSLHALIPDHACRVVILNGFQTGDDLPVTDGDCVTVIEKGVFPPPDVLEAMMAARHSPGVFQKVKHARVAIAGLGGLGSHIAFALARTGVGHLHLVDFDTVEPSNLNRQCYRIRDLGKPKTQALAEQLADVNPYLTITTDCVRVSADNAAALFADDPFVCEAFDAPDAKATLIDAVLSRCPNSIVVAASGMAGYDSCNDIRTRRITDRLYLCGDGQTAARPGYGLMAPRVSVCAGHQANMILRLILGLDMP